MQGATDHKIAAKFAAAAIGALVAVPVSSLAVFLLLGAGPAIPIDEGVKPQAVYTLPGGQHFSALEVTCPPSARAAPDWHGNAFLYAYVLEGEVGSQLGSEQLRACWPGQSWIEQQARITSSRRTSAPAAPPGSS